MSDESSLPKKVNDLMDQHRAWNAENWADFTTAGVTESTLLRFEGAFGTLTESHRDRLARHLREERDCEVTIERGTDPDGIAYPRIVCRTPVRAWTLDALNAWTDNMVVTGWRFGPVMFEGYRMTVIEEVTPLDRLMRYHRDANVEIWAQLQKHGVTPETPLSLEAHFWAKSEAGANGIGERLRDDVGYSVQINPPKRGLFRRNVLWSVTGATAPTMTNPDELDDWTDRMVQAAAQQGVEFDGWGAMVPS